MVRTFLAIELPHSLKQRLSRLEPLSAPHARSIKWTAPDLLHITVRFLGSVPANQLEGVFDAARAATLESDRFVLALSELGAFPNLRMPRVLWVGLVHDAGYASLQALFDRVEAGLSARGFPREKRSFSPHVTLARTHDHISAAERRALGSTVSAAAAHEKVAGLIPVKALTVMRSDLGREGPKYTPLERVDLGAGIRPIR